MAPTYEVAVGRPHVADGFWPHWTTRDPEIMNRHSRPLAGAAARCTLVTPHMVSLCRAAQLATQSQTWSGASGACAAANLSPFSRASASKSGTARSHKFLGNEDD